MSIQFNPDFYPECVTEAALIYNYFCLYNKKPSSKQSNHMILIYILVKVMISVTKYMLSNTRLGVSDTSGHGFIH